MNIQKIRVKSILEDYMNSGTKKFEPNLSLCITTDGIIMFKGHYAGFITDKEGEDKYYQFIVLTLQKSLSDNDFNRMIAIIADCANDVGYLVVFVPMIDIGFGIKFWDSINDKNNILTNLLKVAKFSKEDVKTAATIIASSNTVRGKITDEDFVYSYNQRIDNEVIHAEKILRHFVNESYPTVKFTEWISLIEPCKDCLNDMIQLGATNIKFLVLHKKKWNTDEYLDMVDNIRVGNIKNKAAISDKLIKISYNKMNNEKINKFYRRMNYDSLS